MQPAATPGQESRPVRKRAAHASVDIRRSTRRALREDSSTEKRDSNIDMSARSTMSYQPTRASPRVQRTPSTHTSSQASAGSQIPRPSTAGPPSKVHHPTGTFKNTLRRVFSLGAPENEEGSRIPAKPSSENSSNTSWNNDPVEKPAMSRQNQAFDAYGRPAGSFYHAHMTGDAKAPASTNAHDLQNMDQNAPSRQIPPERRLRRTKSRILRVDPNASTKQIPSNTTSFYSPTTPASAPYLPPTHVFRQSRPTQTSNQNAPPPTGPPPADPRRSDERSQQSGPHSRRDSLEIQRFRYNISRGSHKEGKDADGTDGASAHRLRRSSSSMNMERGSLNSPRQLQPISSASTAPRQAMEVAGMIARLNDLESRMTHVEHTLRRFKDTSYRNADVERLQERHETAMTSTSQVYHTPPSSQKGGRAVDASFLRESSSTPFTDEDSAPSTPIGPALGELQTLPYVSGSEPLAYSGSPEMYSMESNILRESLLTKGYDHTLHKVLHAVNAEHHARIALEANVGSLKNAISALRNEVANHQRPPNAGFRQDIVDAQTQTSARTTISSLRHRTHSSGDRPQQRDARVIDTTLHGRTRSSGEASRRSNGSRSTVDPGPLGYGDLWAYAAVPMNTSPHRLSQEEYDDAREQWIDAAQTKSRFSFDETNSSIVDDAESTQDFF